MKSAFTLIELLIVIAILGVLAAAVLVAIDPGKRTAQARDVKRKGDVNAIANALIGYYTLAGNYPHETACDSSVGADFALPCPPSSLSSWATGGRIYLRLVTEQAFLKNLPTDPLNNNTYYYAYEPRRNDTNDFCGAATECNYYWIGAQLESPADPLKPIFRCSDYPIALLAEGPGCKEVDGTLNNVIPNQ